MADQDNQQFAGQGIPVGGVPQPLVSPHIMPGVPQFSQAAPSIPVHQVPMAQPLKPVSPVIPGPIPMPAPMPSQTTSPMSVSSITPPPAQEAPKKPMTLEDLAKQTPIFSDEELEEDEFDPWAPLNESKPSVSPLPVVTPKPVITPKAEPVVTKASPEIKAKPSPMQAEKPSVPPLPSVDVKDVDEEDEPEVIEGALVNEDEIDPFEGLEEDTENPLKNFLANANINGKKIAGCIAVFILAIALIVGLFYGGRALFHMLTENTSKDGTPQETEEDVNAEKVKEEKPEVSRVVVEPPVKEDKKPDSPWVEPGLYAGVKVGMEAAEGDGGVISNIPGVDISQSNENIVAYVNILARIRVLYEMDIQNVLNASNDRNSTFNNLLSDMKSVSAEARNAIPKIAERKAALEAEFDSVTAAKQLKEEEYFANLSANNPRETSESLVLFTELARQSVDIRARYRALNKVEEYMQRYLSAMETRVLDIELNREALIKGVKVFDIEGSDIDLIIPESEL